MKIRQLREDEVTFTITVEPEDIRVEGNALASGDEEVDQACYREIRRRLEQGDVWAWCIVIVKAQWNGWVGSDSLGGCSYEDEADFKQCPYFTDMKHEALADLNRRLAENAEELSELEQLVVVRQYPATLKQLAAWICADEHSLSFASQARTAMLRRSIRENALRILEGQFIPEREMTSPEKCDECGAIVPESADSVMGSYHEPTCSAFIPKEETDA